VCVCGVCACELCPGAILCRFFQRLLEHGVIPLTVHFLRWRRMEGDSDTQQQARVTMALTRRATCGACYKSGFIVCVMGTWSARWRGRPTSLTSPATTQIGTTPHTPSCTTPAHLGRSLVKLLLRHVRPNALIHGVVEVPAPEHDHHALGLGTLRKGLLLEAAPAGCGGCRAAKRRDGH
jgi:hypothetical protein